MRDNSEYGNENIIEVIGLRKCFSKQVALNDVSFSLKRGRILTVIGPSGSGKTTLLRILCQLETPDSGDVVISGLKLNESKQQNKLLLSKVGLVFQSFNLFPHLTVLDNVTLAYRFAHSKGLGYSNRDGKREAEAVALDLLERVQLKDKADKYPCMLSGGESQRVAIARSLALKPDVLFFDEPTSALDLEMVKKLSALVKQIRDDENNTLVVVTHDINFAKLVSDDVLFLDKGDMVFFGKAGDVFDCDSRNERVQRFFSNSDLFK